MAGMEPSDQVMMNANRTLQDVRHNRSIGTRSESLKRGDFLKKLGRAGMVVGGILVGTAIVGGIIDGIGFWGVLISAGLIGAGIWATMKYPKMKLPTPASLVQSDLKTLAGKTEIWLENQRPALPAPAVQIINDIGMQLDALSPQLQKLDEKEPAAYEVRKLVGEHLPELIDGYRAIPASLRRSANDGEKSPDEQLVNGLSVIENEISNVTLQIAKGNIDNLSIRERFLELKYDKAAETE